MARSNIPSDRAVQDPVHIDVPPHAVAVALVRRGVPLIRGAVPAISRRVTLVRQPVTLIGFPVMTLLVLATALASVALWLS